MTDILGYFITLIAGVGIATIYFVSKRQEPANTSPHDQLVGQIKLLSARISALENKKLSKVETAEFTDAIKQVMQDHQKIKAQLNDVMTDFNTTVLRLIATFSRKEKKPLLPKEHPEAIPQYRVGV